MTLLDELKALVEKYGYDPKNGGLDRECWNCRSSLEELPLGEKLVKFQSPKYECSVCSKKFADT